MSLDSKDLGALQPQVPQQPGPWNFVDLKKLRNFSETKVAEVITNIAIKISSIVIVNRMVAVDLLVDHLSRPTYLDHGRAGARPYR